MNTISTESKIAQPELSKEEIAEISTQICMLFPDDIDRALNECRKYIKQYYFCPQLVLALTNIIYSGAVWDNPEKPNLEIIEEAMGYLSHVASTSNDTETARSARHFLGTLLLLQDEIDEAIEQFEALIPPQPLEVEILLATAYEKAGEYDKAIRINQENLYSAASNVLNSCTSLLTLADNDLEQLDALIALAEPLASELSKNTRGSMRLISLYFDIASAYRKIGEKKLAYDHLDRSADLALRYESFIPETDQSSIFSHIQDIVNPKLVENEKEHSEDTAAKMLSEGLRQMTTSFPEWADAVYEERYKKIITKLEAL